MAAWNPSLPPSLANLLGISSSQAFPSTLVVRGRLNNCIGFYNLKYFYLFILYMAVLTAFMLVTMTPVFVHDVTSMETVAIDFTVC